MTPDQKADALRAEDTLNAITAIEANLAKMLGEISAGIMRADATNAILYQLAQDLRMIRLANANQEGPNIQYPLTHYKEEWAEDIGAEVVATDANGPTIVRWNEQNWKRRSGTGKFGNAIWFSRALGQDENGANYTRLITFKNLEDVEPLADQIVAALAGAATSPSPKPDPHLTYLNAKPVPNHPQTIATFNAFLASERRKPKNAEELKQWYSQHQPQNTQQNEPEQKTN